MDLIMLILVIALLGFIVHLIVTHIPMSPPFRTGIYIICLIAIVLILLRQFGGLLPNVL